MAKINYIQRIKNLISFNFNDAEIKKIIYKEYNIYLSSEDIQNKRVSKSDKSIVSFHSIEEKTKIIQKILKDNLDFPLTKKEIIRIALDKFNVIISQEESKEIFWRKLRNEIIYDKNEWTYRLKNKNDFENINSPNLENLVSKIENITSRLNFDKEVLIDNSNFKIYKKKEFFKPIFYYNFNSLNGDNEIIINLSHEHYRPEYEEFIIKIACSMYYTKSSMTSNVIDIFINRLLSNLALIHE